MKKKPTLKIPQATAKGYVEVEPGMVFDYSFPNSKLRRGRLQFAENGICVSPTLTATYGQILLYEDCVENHPLIIPDLVMEPQIKQIGSYSPSSACNAKVLDPDGICPTLLNHKGAEPAVLTQQRSEQAKQLRREGIETFSHREFVARNDGVSNTLTSVHKDNLLLEPKSMTTNEACQAIIDGAPGMVIANTQVQCYRGTVNDSAPCVCAAAGMGGGHVAMITEEPKIVGYTRDDKGRVKSYHFKDTSNTLHTGGGTTAQYVAEQNKTKTTMYRIRKLTPTETFKLMDVEAADIEKIEAYPWKSYAEREEALSGLTDKERKRELRKGISKSAKYKLAGNSIVCSCLYNIFRTLFIPHQPENTTQHMYPTLFD